MKHLAGKTPLPPLLPLLGVLAAVSCRTVRRSPATSRIEPGPPSRVILLIGDGMGAMQIESTREALAAKDEGFRISFEDFPVVATQRTRSASSPVTDSAAAATAMACGVRTTNGYLGVSPEGSNLVSITDVAAARGWKIGLLTSQSMDHATPAGFYAHTTNRLDYAGISRQLAGTRFSFIGGGALRGRFGGAGRRPEDGGGVDLLANCASNWYRVARSREDCARTPPTSGVFAVTSGASPKFGPATHAADSGEMRLRDFTAAALEHFGDSPFFLMVEGGQIDSACHNNDLGTMVRETEEFDEAVRTSLEYAATRPGVLIVVTADHETGGLRRIEPPPAGLSPGALLGQTEDGPSILATLAPLAEVRAPFNDVKKALDVYFGKRAFDAEDVAALRRAWEDGRGALAFCMEAARLFAARAGYVFTAGSSHTGADVPVFAYGAGAGEFAGIYDNTSIFDRLKRLIDHPAE